MSLEWAGQEVRGHASVKYLWYLANSPRAMLESNSIYVVLELMQAASFKNHDW